MWRVVVEFLGWPDGSVWPNIVASVVWTIPALTVHHVLLKRHFRNKLAEHLRSFMDDQ